MAGNSNSPIFEHHPADEAVFLHGNMLESARVQKKLPPLIAPAGCLLDFDGELVEYFFGQRSPPQLRK